MLSSYAQYDIIIAPGAYHRTLLAQKSIQRGDRFIVLTKEQVFERLYFKIHHERAQLYLFRKGISLAKSTTLLNHLYFLKPHLNPIMDEWMQLREECIEQKLIIPSSLGAIFFKHKKIYVVGYPTDDGELVEALKPYAHQLDFESTTPIHQPRFSVHVFLDTEAEVRYGLNAIAHELKRGRLIQDIQIMRPSEEYIEPLMRLSEHYRIPIDFDRTISLDQTPIGIQTLRALEQQKPAEFILELLTHFPDVHRLPIQTLLNALALLQLNQTQKVAWFAHQLKQVNIESPSLTNAIRIKTSYVPTQQWVWVLGFNQPHWPITQRDDDTISDQLKTRLGRLTSKQVNRFEHDRCLQFLSASPHLLITYKRFHLGQAYQPSSLLFDCVIEHTFENPTFPIDYGRNQALITRERLKEKLKIYRIEDPLLVAYTDAISTPIQPFDGQFKPWKSRFHETWNKLSYSKLSDFYKCHFKYYLSKHLQLQTQDDQFYAHLGTLMHNIFEKTQSSAEQFEEVFTSEYAKLKKDFLPRKQLIVEGLKQDMKRVVLFNLKHRSQMKLTTMVAEQEVKIPINATMGFSGKIDKIVVTTDGKEKYVSLIDYKTGKESFVEEEIELGWSLQLPIYAWLVSKHPDFQTYQLIGLYIQHVLDDSLLNQEGTDEDEHVEKLLKLDGVATEHMGPLSTFDPTYQDSAFIKSIKLKADGTFGKKAKVRTNAQFEAYKTVAEEKIMYAVQHIQQGDFKINPIRFRKKHSCTHCPFQDVCFRKDRDVEYKQLKKDLEDEPNTNS